MNIAHFEEKKAIILSENFIRNQILQKGMGLLELMLSLLVLSVLMMAVLSYYYASSTSQKVNNAIYLIQGLLVASEDFLETYHTYIPDSDSVNNPSISIKRLVELGKLSRDFCNHSDCANNTANPWGGSVSLHPKDERHIEIMLNQLPSSNPGQGVCQQLKDLLKGKVLSDCSKSLEGKYFAIYPLTSED